MIQAVDKVIWTIEDLELMPDCPDKHYEIIDGELFVTRTPHRRHQQICGLIFTQLNSWSQKTNLGETIIAPGVIFSERDNVIPDVVWISKERLAEIEDEAGHLIGTPELMVEVISQGNKNEKRDRQLKLKLYSEQGVQEYWLVDRFNMQVEVYRRENTKLNLVETLSTKDKLQSPLLPNFVGNIALFFPN